MNHRSSPIDTRIEIIAPENIAFQYAVAGPFRRLPAYVIDLVIRIITVIVCTLAFLFLSSTTFSSGAFGLGLALVLWFVLDWFYGGFFETVWNGQTPGKRIMKIRVISIDGRPINGTQAVMRNILRAVDSQPVLFYQLGFWTACANDRFQRIGDLACGTMVVVEERADMSGVIRVSDEKALELADRIPIQFRVTRGLAKALSAYVERRRLFSEARRAEIASRLAEPLRMRWNWPPTDPDRLLCALYHRVFVEENRASKERSVETGSSAIPIYEMLAEMEEPQR